jgi:hypothetical protein
MQLTAATDNARPMTTTRFVTLRIPFFEFAFEETLEADTVRYGGVLLPSPSTHSHPHGSNANCCITVHPSVVRAPFEARVWLWLHWILP